MHNLSPSVLLHRSSIHRSPHPLLSARTNSSSSRQPATITYNYTAEAASCQSSQSCEIHERWSKRGGREGNIGQREREGMEEKPGRSTREERKKEGKRSARLHDVQSNGSGVAGRAESWGAQAHRRRERWRQWRESISVSTGGSWSAARRRRRWRASENDAHDTVASHGTGESGAPLDARCTKGQVETRTTASTTTRTWNTANARFGTRMGCSRWLVGAGALSGERGKGGREREVLAVRRGRGGQPKCRPRNEWRRAGAADAPVPQRPRASLNLVFETNEPRLARRESSPGQHEIPCCVQLRPRSSRRSFKVCA